MVLSPQRIRAPSRTGPIGARWDTGLVTACCIRLRRWSPDDTRHDRPSGRQRGGDWHTYRAPPTSTTSSCRPRGASWSSVPGLYARGTRSSGGREQSDGVGAGPSDFGSLAQPALAPRASARRRRTRRLHRLGSGTSRPRMRLTLPRLSLISGSASRIGLPSSSRAAGSSSSTTCSGPAGVTPRGNGTWSSTSEGTHHRTLPHPAPCSMPPTGGSGRQGVPASRLPARVLAGSTSRSGCRRKYSSSSCSVRAVCSRSASGEPCRNVSCRVA